MKYLMIALMGACLVGCGSSDLTSVTGTVTLDGAPVANAVITFESDSGGVACSGSSDSSGKYIIGCQFGEGAPPGDYSVKIKSREVSQSGSNNPMAGLTPGTPEYIEAYQKMMAAGPNRSAYKEKIKGEIPEKYNSGKELKATVGKSAQTIDFKLDSK